MTRLLWGKECFLLGHTSVCVCWGGGENDAPTCALGPVLRIESRPVDKAYAQRN